MYTRGGMPIWFTGLEKTSRKKKNRRYECKKCPNKTTHRQLRFNSGVCFSCKTPIIINNPK